MLGDDTDESLEGSEYRPVDGDRASPGAVLRDKLEFKALRKHDKIELDRSHLPIPAYRVFDLDVNLRSVERPLLRPERVCDLPVRERVLEARLRLVPQFRVSHGVIGPGRNAVGRSQTENRVELGDQVDEPVNLRKDLIGPAVDMGIVHRDLAD